MEIQNDNMVVQELLQQDTTYAGLPVFVTVYQRLDDEGLHEPQYVTGFYTGNLEEGDGFWQTLQTSFGDIDTCMLALKRAVDSYRMRQAPHEEEDVFVVFVRMQNGRVFRYFYIEEGEANSAYEELARNVARGTTIKFIHYSQVAVFKEEILN